MFFRKISAETGIFLIAASIGKIIRCCFFLFLCYNPGRGSYLNFSSRLPCGVMLRSLLIDNFTVFSSSDVQFVEGINVIIGENGLGKSHLLKLAYCAANISHTARSNGTAKQDYQRRIAQKLGGIFRPDYLGRLTRRKAVRSRCEVAVQFIDEANNFSFSFASNSREEVTLDKVMSGGVNAPAIFFPTMEIISIYPGFAALYRDNYLSFDETYYDLCLALERPLKKGKQYDDVNSFLEPIETILGGKVRCESGRFLLALPGKGNMEISLVAEGHRKFATIAYLLANGSILQNGMLFWDEPETNLNPALMRDLAQTLIHLTQLGIQVFLTSHSLFFIKELDLQLQQQASKIPSKWFAFGGHQEGITISEGDSLEEVEPILALDVEMEQSDRYYQFVSKKG